MQPKAVVLSGRSAWTSLLIVVHCIAGSAPGAPQDTAGSYQNERLGYPLSDANYRTEGFPRPEAHSWEGDNRRAANNLVGTQQEQHIAYDASVSNLRGFSTQALPADDHPPPAVPAGLDSSQMELGQTEKRTPFAPPGDNAQLGKEQSEATSPLGALVSVASSLLVVLGLFLGLAWILRRTNGGHSAGLPPEVFEVLGKSTLAAKHQVLVVRFGPKILLVNQQQGELRTLSELQDASDVQQVLQACDTDSLDPRASLRGNSGKDTRRDSVLGAGVENARLLAQSLFQGKGLGRAAEAQSNRSGTLDQGV